MGGRKGRGVGGGGRGSERVEKIEERKNIGDEKKRKREMGRKR